MEKKKRVEELRDKSGLTQIMEELLEKEREIVKKPPIKEHEEAPKYSLRGYEPDFAIERTYTGMNLDTLLELGKAAFQIGNYDLALDYFTKASNIDPTHKESEFLKKRTGFLKSKLFAQEAKEQKTPRKQKWILAQVKQATAHVDHRKVSELEMAEIPIESEVIRMPETHVTETDILKSRELTYQTKESYVKREGSKVAALLIVFWLIIFILFLWYFGYLDF